VAHVNEKWAGDISYIWTGEGWLYLAVILDLHSRRVIGWAVSDRMKRDLAIRALQMAINLRQPPPGCIHHTDRGSQYCSHDYQKILRRHGFEGIDERQGQLLRQFRGGDLLQDAQGRADLAASVGDPAAGGNRVRHRSRTDGDRCLTSNTSTGSTIRAAGIQPSAGKARSPSRARGPERATNPALFRSKSMKMIATSVPGD
jgi:hypothetical protein